MQTIAILALACVISGLLAYSLRREHDNWPSWTLAGVSGLCGFSAFMITVFYHL